MSATMTANPNATQNIIIRAIEKRDNAGIARVIREVSAEHGLTADKGFAVADPILDTALLNSRWLKNRICSMALTS